MTRRAFATACTVPLLAGASVNASPSRIIDTHVHFYDPSRPQGVPWPSKDDRVLYRTVLPDEFQRLTKPFGVTQAIEVEASPWVEDNEWVLNLAERYPFIVGTVGNIDPRSAEFPKQLERFHRNKRFRGIRCGNLWNRDLGDTLSAPHVRDNLKLVAEAGLELDSANPNGTLIAQIIRLTDQVPHLRVVVDHLPVDPPPDKTAREQLGKGLRELGRRPQVFIKVSSVARRVNGVAPADAAHYKPALDELWEVFGPDRLLYGSNWPVSDLTAPYATVIKIVKEYFGAKGHEASEKYFWRNATLAYGLTNLA